MESDLPFHNLPLDLAELPVAATVPGKALQSKYLRQQVISNSLFFLILLIGILVLLMNTPLSEFIWAVAAMIGGWVLLLSLSLVAIVKGFRYKSYALREQDILYRSGWLWRSEIIIPFNRVQHCEVSQGPIEKWLTLAQLKVFTAGGQSADLSIPGISPEEAQQLKEYIIKRTGTDVAS